MYDVCIIVSIIVSVCYFVDSCACFIVGMSRESVIVK